MRGKKGVLLFEVAFVVLLVSIISLFLFRGYGLFLKTGKKSLDYLKLMLISEEKAWDLQREEKKKPLPEDIEMSGSFRDGGFNWSLQTEDFGYGNLKKGVLSVNYQDQRKTSLDMVIFLKFE